jgi:hypothetical protein
MLYKLRPKPTAARTSTPKPPVESRAPQPPSPLCQTNKFCHRILSRPEAILLILPKLARVNSIYIPRLLHPLSPLHPHPLPAKSKSACTTDAPTRPSAAPLRKKKKKSHVAIHSKRDWANATLFPKRTPSTSQHAPLPRASPAQRAYNPSNPSSSPSSSPSSPSSRATRVTSRAASPLQRSVRLTAYSRRVTPSCDIHASPG